MNYKILGTTEDRTDCENCGKRNLKKTVALQILDSSEIVYFGTTCAARATGRKHGAIKSEANAVEVAQKWLDAGHTKETVAMGIWNKFGFPTEVKNGNLRISNFAEL